MARVVLGYSDLDVDVVVPVDVAVHLADALALQTDGLVHLQPAGIWGASGDYSGLM